MKNDFFDSVYYAMLYSVVACLIVCPLVLLVFAAKGHPILVVPAIAMMFVLYGIYRDSAPPKQTATEYMRNAASIEEAWLKAETLRRMQEVNAQVKEHNDKVTAAQPPKPEEPDVLDKIFHVKS